MLRYFGIVVAIIVVVIAGWLLSMYVAGKKAGEGTKPSVDDKSVKGAALNVRAVRQLDKLMTDNTLIGNDQWRKETNDIIDNWYN